MSTEVAPVRPAPAYERPSRAYVIARIVWLYLVVLGPCVTVVLTAWIIVNGKSAMPSLRASTNASSVPMLAAGTYHADPEVGGQLFSQNCASCHGTNGEGVALQGVPLKTSKFVANNDDHQLLTFMTRGRGIGDPDSLMNRVMPARGGNPLLSDAELYDIIAYLRTLQAKDGGGSSPLAITAPQASMAAQQ
jgi:mono/diheme cytochrome c family protein